MVWILVTTAFLMVFGGIFLVLPSKHEREIGRMRIDARKSGLNTQGIVVTDVNASAMDRVTAGGQIRMPKVQCIAWEKQYLDEFENIPLWTLYKSSQNNGPIEGYIFESQLDETRLEDQPEYWRKVSKIIDQLPATIVAVKSGQRGVSWVGREKLDSTPAGFVVQMSTGLQELAEANIDLARELPDR